MNDKNHDFDVLADNILKQYDVNEQYTLVSRMVYQLSYQKPTLDTKWYDFCLAHYGMSEDACKMNRSLTFAEIFEKSKRTENIMNVLAPESPEVNPIFGTACLATLHEIIQHKRNIITRMLDKIGISFMK